MFLSYCAARKEACYESHSSGKTRRRSEVLKLVDIAPIEAPGPGQAVVRIVAAGVNFADVGQRRGTYPRQVPFTPGMEGVGVWLNPLAKASGT